MPRPRQMGQTRPLDDVEREYILAAVETAGGNRTRAAAELEIGLATLKRKLKRYEGLATPLGASLDARRFEAPRGEGKASLPPVSSPAASPAQPARGQRPRMP
jgi:regulatory Fis family protein